MKVSWCIGEVIFDYRRSSLNSKIKKKHSCSRINCFLLLSISFFLFVLIKLQIIVEIRHVHRMHLYYPFLDLIVKHRNILDIFFLLIFTATGLFFSFKFLVMFEYDFFGPSNAYTRLAYTAFSTTHLKYWQNRTVNFFYFCHLSLRFDLTILMFV